MTAKIKRFTITASLLLLLPSLANAFIVYRHGQSPIDIKRKGNSYRQFNFYDKNNPNNPYSKYRNPYSSESYRNNYNHYLTPLQDFKHQRQGNFVHDTYNRYNTY